MCLKRVKVNLLSHGTENLWSRLKYYFIKYHATPTNNCSAAFDPVFLWQIGLARQPCKKRMHIPGLTFLQQEGAKSPRMDESLSLNETSTFITESQSPSVFPKNTISPRESRQSSGSSLPPTAPKHPASFNVMNKRNTRKRISEGRNSGGSKKRKTIFSQNVPKEPKLAFLGADMHNGGNRAAQQKFVASPNRKQAQQMLVPPTQPASQRNHQPPHQPAKPSAAPRGVVDIFGIPHPPNTILRNDIHHPLSPADWLRVGIRPSPFDPNPSYPQTTLEMAWKSFHNRLPNSHFFPIPELLIVRLHLLSTLWYYATTVDKRKYIASPTLAGVGMEVLDHLLSRLGCLIVKRSKISKKEFVFIIELRFCPADRKPSFNHLDDGIKTKMKNPVEDMAALKELEKVWKPYLKEKSRELDWMSVPKAPMTVVGGQRIPSGPKGGGSAAFSAFMGMDVVDTEATASGESFVEGMATSRKVVSPTSSDPEQSHEQYQESVEEFSADLEMVEDESSSEENDYDMSPTVAYSVGQNLREFQPLDVNLQVEHSADPNRQQISTEMNFETETVSRDSDQSPSLVFQDSDECLLTSAPARTSSTMSSLISPRSENRFAELKAQLIQAKTRTIADPEEIDSPTAMRPRSSRLNALDIFHDVARQRIASPELKVPAEGDYWQWLNYEKRSEKVDLELLDLFLLGELRSVD